MPRKKSKKSRKPLRYKTITIKVTARQKRSLVNYCKSRRTTPNKLIKKSIRPFMQNYAGLAVAAPTPVNVQQLVLFEQD